MSLLKYKKKIRKKLIKNKIICFLLDVKKKFVDKKFNKLSDEEFATKKYKINTGKKLNLNNPTTFDEKLWWLKYHNRDPLLTRCTDKYLVRTYVKECGLEHILNPIYGVYNDPEEIEFNNLPEDRVFFKCNHASGMNAIFDKNKKTDLIKFKKKFKKYLKQNYYFRSREWNYKDIIPKIICEKMLPEDIKNIYDYRFFCFDGVVKLVLVDTDVCASDGRHHTNSKRCIFDRNFKRVNLKMNKESVKHDIPKPDNFDEMVKYAEILSTPFVHCRVDLYNIKGKIYFSEITFFNNAGYNIMEPQEWEYTMGNWIDLNSEKIILK